MDRADRACRKRCAVLAAQWLQGGTVHKEYPQAIMADGRAVITAMTWQSLEGILREYVASWRIEAAACRYVKAYQSLDRCKASHSSNEYYTKKHEVDLTHESLCEEVDRDTRITLRGGGP